MFHEIKFNKKANNFSRELVPMLLFLLLYSHYISPFCHFFLLKANETRVVDKLFLMEVCYHSMMKLETTEGSHKYHNILCIFLFLLAYYNKHNLFLTFLFFVFVAVLFNLKITVFGVLELYMLN